MSVLSADNPSTSFDPPRIPTFLKDIWNTTELSDTEEFDWLDVDHYFSIDPHTNASKTLFLGSRAHMTIRGLCKQLFMQRIHGCRIRYWDLAILTPNILFLIFLFIKCSQVKRRFWQKQNSIFKTFFMLVYIAAFINVTRSIISLLLGFAGGFEEIADRVLWRLFKFSFLSVELCVLCFGLFGCIESSTSSKNVFGIILAISLIHLAIQILIEFFLSKDELFQETSDIYYHGTIGFWMCSSAIFALIYSALCFFPFTCVRKMAILPVKCSLYAYCLTLALLNALQLVSAVLILANSIDGICIVELTTCLYVILYAPALYFIFVRNSLSENNSGAPLLSYKKQKNEMIHGDLSDVVTYYPHFSGLTSPSYDDLFNCDTTSRPRFCMIGRASPDFGIPDRTDRDQLGIEDFFSYEVPLLMNAQTPDSTATTQVDIDCSLDCQSKSNESGKHLIETKSASFETNSLPTNTGPRHLRGLGPNGTLIFSNN